MRTRDKGRSRKNKRLFPPPSPCPNPPVPRVGGADSPTRPPLPLSASAARFVSSSRPEGCGETFRGAPRATRGVGWGRGCGPGGPTRPGGNSRSLSARLGGRRFYLERLVVGSRMTIHSLISPNLLK